MDSVVDWRFGQPEEAAVRASNPRVAQEAIHIIRVDSCVEHGVCAEDAV